MFLGLSETGRYYLSGLRIIQPATLKNLLFNFKIVNCKLRKKRQTLKQSSVECPWVHKQTRALAEINTKSTRAPLLVNYVSPTRGVYSICIVDRNSCFFVLLFTSVNNTVHLPHTSRFTFSIAHKVTKLHFLMAYSTER